MKRGPSRAVFQNGRAELAENRKGRDGVDGHCPEHGQHHHREVMFQRRFAAAVTAVQHVHRQGQVQRQVAIQHHHVPGQQRGRPVHAANEGDQVPGALRMAQVGQHEHHGADDGRHRQAFADLHHRLHVDTVKDVSRNDQQHRRRRDAHQESEVADVEAPRNLVAQAGDDKAVAQLQAVGPQACTEHQRQHTQPDPVSAAAAQQAAQRVGEEADQCHDCAGRSSV